MAQRPAPAWDSLAAGARAAGVSWAAVTALALLVWFVTPAGSVGFTEAVAVATAGWFLGTGATLVVGSVPFGLVPLGFWALAVWAAVVVLRRHLARVRASTPPAALATQLARHVVPRVSAGYAAALAGLGLITLAGPARPTLGGFVAALGVPVTALVVVLALDIRAGQAPAQVGQWLERVPVWVRRGVRPGLTGAVALGCCATVLVLAMVAARLGTVAGLYAATGAGVLGGVVLTVLQLLYLPNVALWALAWIAGPGFEVTAGAAITQSGAQPGLVPLIPLLGALPSEGALPAWVRGVLVVPVAAGALVAWRSSRQWSRLGSWRAKCLTSLSGVGTTVLLIGLVAGLAAGPAGVDRLSSVGANPVLLVLSLSGELLLGAAIALLVELVRVRLPGRFSGPDGGPSSCDSGRPPARPSGQALGTERSGVARWWGARGSRGMR